MSGAPAITVDGAGNSFVVYGVGITGGNVNLTTIKRDVSGNLQWAGSNTLTASGTVATTASQADTLLFSQPAAIDISGSVIVTPTNISYAIVPPPQTYSSLFDAALPLAATLSVQVVGENITTVPVPTGTAVEEVVTLVLTNYGSSSIVGTVATVNIGTPTSSPFSVDVWYAGKNSSRTGLTPNKKRITGVNFIDPAGPSSVTIGGISLGSYSITVPYSQPTDVYSNATTGVKMMLGAAGAPTFGAYTVTATPINASSVRYEATNAVTTTTSGLSANVTGLSPNITYDVSVTASNSLGSTGPAATTSITTPMDNSLIPPYVDGITPFTTDFTGLYYGSTAIPSTDIVKRLSGGKWTQTLPAIGIHNTTNTGSTAPGIMSLGAKIGSAAGVAISYGGYGIAAPSAATANNWTLTGGAIGDVSSGAASGYYQRVPITVSYTPTAGTGTATAQVVTLTQTLSGGATKTKTANLWWDGTASTATPSITVTGGIADTTKLKSICGTKYFGGDYGFTGITTSFTNMGTNLARANPITVSVADIANTTLFSRLGNPIVSPMGSGTASFTGGSTYRRGYQMTAQGTNLYGGVATSGGYAQSGGFPIIDPAGVALWNSVNSTVAAPALSTSYVTGPRIKTADAIAGTITVYDDTVSLATATAEAIISQGYFCAPGYPNAYATYPGGVDYSTTTTGSGGLTAGYRYATLQWGPQTDAATYGYIGVQITAPTGVLTLAKDGLVTNTSAATESFKLRDAAGALVDIYFKIKKTDTTWTGLNDLGATTAATGGAQASATGQIPTQTTVAGQDIFDFTGVLPGINSLSVSRLVVIVGGKGGGSGSAFKITACYKNF